MCGLKTTSARANDTDSIPVNFRTRQQIVHGANSVPGFPPGKIRAHQIRQVAHYRMFRADQIVTTLRLLRIPELAALSLPDRIPSQHDVSPFCQPLAQILVINLPVGCVARRHKHGRTLLRVIGWDVNQRGNIYARKAFKD